MTRPEAQFTLTECYDKLYDKSEHSLEYRRAIVAQLHSWERLTGSLCAATAVSVARPSTWR